MQTLVILLLGLIYSVIGAPYDIGVPCGKDQTNYDPYTAQVTITGTATAMASALEIVLFNDYDVEGVPLTKGQTVVIVEGTYIIYE